jgi:hypothetical protein
MFNRQQFTCSYIEYRLALVSVLMISLGSSLANAGTVTTSVEGYFNRSQENECLHLSKFFYLADCSYGRVTESLRGNTLVWSGPTSNAVYFERESELADPLYVPQAGDERYRPPMTGEITIDDNNTEDPADDLISGTLVVGAASRSLITNIPEIRTVRGGGKNAQPRAVHSWSKITHTLAPAVVTQAVATETGGVTYVIASLGFPDVVCFTSDNDDCFPAENSRKIETGQDAEGDWSAPSQQPLPRGEALGGNIGALTTAVAEGSACADNVGGDSCLKGQTVWGSDKEDFGLDNILIKVSADGAGKVLSLEAFWTVETRIDAGPPIFQTPESQPNSWTAGYMEAVALTE